MRGSKKLWHGHWIQETEKCTCAHERIKTTSKAATCIAKNNHGKQIIHSLQSASGRAEKRAAGEEANVTPIPGYKCAQSLLSILLYLQLYVAFHSRTGYGLIQACRLLKWLTIKSHQCVIRLIALWLKLWTASATLQCLHPNCRSANSGNSSVSKGHF